MANTEGLLYRSWSFWYLIPDRFSSGRNADWKEFLHQISSISSIDEFWATYNALDIQHHQLPKGCRLYLFKNGVSPLWEDHANAGGSEVSTEIEIQKGKTEITDKWTDVMLSLVGETIAHSDSINGIEFNVRTETYRISLWVQPGTSSEIVSAISGDLQKRLSWKSQMKVSTIPSASK